MVIFFVIDNMKRFILFVNFDVNFVVALILTILAKARCNHYGCVLSQEYRHGLYGIPYDYFVYTDRPIIRDIEPTIYCERKCCLFSLFRWYI